MLTRFTVLSNRSFEKDMRYSDSESIRFDIIVYTRNAFSVAFFGIEKDQANFRLVRKRIRVKERNETL